MASSPKPYTNEQDAEDAGETRIAPKAPGKVQSASVYQLSLRGSDMSTMEDQAKEMTGRGKTQGSHRIGQCVSIDQLKSRTPGLIAQVKGWLTNKRYQAATIFVNHSSGLSYIYLQQTTNAIDTLAAKKSFEAFANRSVVGVKSYQADHGRFAENAFMESVRASNQTITFCGVNAHFQNEVAERMIRNLQDQAMTMLIHTQHWWPEAVDAHLWPYALRTANVVSNQSPVLNRDNGMSPMELFTKSPIRPNMNDF